MGQGGHGTVYKAEHRILGRLAAVKVLHPHLADNREMLQRFVREARVVNQIRHPNVVDIHDFGLLRDGRPYLVMELLPSRTLSHVLREQGRLSPERVLAYLLPVCAALEAVHRAGVVHRDLKASNVAVLSEGNELPRVKLLDFGIAKFIRPEPGFGGLTVAGQRLGSLHAMAPEQLRGDPIGPATDIYALGVLLYQLLTATHPFHAHDPVELEMLHLEMPPPKPSERVPMSPALDAVVLRCMEKDASRRYPDVASFLAALRDAVFPPSSERLAAHTRGAHALALHVTVAPEGDDDRAYATTSELLDGVEEELRSAGFLLAVRTGLTLLGVHLLEGASATPRRLVEKGRELHARALARALAHLDVRVKVSACAHLGRVDIRQASGQLEVVGGPAVDIAGWVVRDGGEFVLSPEAAWALREAA
ncbi:serine/threonine-protein kinase [Pyxidicoccus fallax]|uniref:serine/threonine-protein kinase n=1 Tax=Pyxidicoccus fallax TaxID=394095 RepID=UPI001FE9934D|nr:serine/threonine-protein kinase [Pyxidicoccus fallax]